MCPLLCLTPRRKQDSAATKPRRRKGTEIRKEEKVNRNTALRSRRRGPPRRAAVTMPFRECTLEQPCQKLAGKVSSPGEETSRTQGSPVPLTIRRAGGTKLRLFATKCHSGFSLTLAAAQDCPGPAPVFVLLLILLLQLDSWATLNRSLSLSLSTLI